MWIWVRGFKFQKTKTKIYIKIFKIKETILIILLCKSYFCEKVKIDYLRELPLGFVAVDQISVKKLRPRRQKIHILNMRGASRRKTINIAKDPAVHLIAVSDPTLWRRTDSFGWFGKYSLRR